ncbi:MAG: uroporphyrinogen decarboxylase family protein, partial [Ruthenibacterium sp.]
IAEHSAFLGGKVTFAANTSWQEVTVPNLEDLSGISMDENNAIYQMVIDGITHIRKKYGDLLAPQVRGTSGALEIANALRGNDFFYDFYEDPDNLKKLLAVCRDAIIWYYNKQLEAAGDYYGGVVTGFGQWLEGRPLGHLSEDTTTMISLAQYEEFGRPYTQAICDQFDDAFIHTHAMSERCLGAISHIKGIKVMELSSDPNTDRAIEVYRRNKNEFDAIPVLCLTQKEIEQNMALLKSQKTIIWYEAQTVQEAQEICALVRTQLPVE